MKKSFLVFFSFMLLFLLGGCASKSYEDDGYVSEKEVQIRMDLAESYIQVREFRKALKELLRIESKARKNPKFHYNLGMVYWALQEIDKAEERLEKAVRIDPTYAKAFNSLGRVYQINNKSEKAIQAYQKALDELTYLTPEFPAFNLAQLYYNQKDLQKAEKYIRVAIDKNWRYSPSYLLLADILLKKGKVEQAIEWLKIGAEADLENLTIPLRLAENLLRVGKTEEAKKWFIQIIETDPKSPQAEVAKDYLDIL